MKYVKDDFISILKEQLFFYFEIFIPVNVLITVMHNI